MTEQPKAKALHAATAHLTPKQRAVWEVASQVVREDPAATISEVAREAGCAPSSVTTLARRLGYLGWPDMRRHLLDDGGDPAPDDGDEQTRPELAQVRELLLRAHDRAVFVHDAGDGTFAGTYLCHVLVAHGFQCMVYDRRALLAQARQGRAGVLFLFNESGIVLADDARVARDLGYAVVALTGNALSPVARLADVRVILKSNKSKLIDYNPDFYCARAIVFCELLQARLPYLYDASIEDDVAFMDLDVQEQG